MNRNIYKYLYAVLLLSLTLLPTGCISDGEGLCPEPDNSTTSYVTFRVVAPKAMVAGTATRAVPDVDNAANWGDNYLPEEGVDFDNALIGNQFNVFVTDNTGGTLITKLQNILYIKTTDSDDNVVYSFSGEIPKDDVENLKSYTNAKIHIVANCSPSTTLDGALTFSYAGQPSETFTAIPMWGVETFDFTTLKPGYNDAGEIWLLRAMAKVEIEIASSTVTDPNLITKLVSATVNGTNTQGFVLPATWNSVEETKKIAFASTMRIPSGITTATINNMQPGADDKITFYLPETANTNGNVNISLEYAVNGGDETMINEENRTNTIHFAVYDDAGMMTPDTYNDIVRNHLYRFTVKLGRTDVEAQIRYTVCLMNELESNIPEFN